MSRLKKIAGNPELAMILASLIEDIKGEYDAINQYKNHIESINIPEVKKILEHIKSEEEQHVEELNKLIQKYQ